MLGGGGRWTPARGPDIVGATNAGRRSDGITPTGTRVVVEEGRLPRVARRNDAWSGTLSQPNRVRTDGPFATLERARDAVRAESRRRLPRDGVVVELEAGTYQVTRPLELGAADSGSESAPVVYRAARDADIRLMGGKILSGFGPVTDPQALARLDPAAQGKVLQTNLRDQGIFDLGGITAPGWAQGQPGLELFFKGRRMTIARWPNEDFVKIASIDVEGNTPLRNRVTLSGRMRGSNEGRFVYEGDRPSALGRREGRVAARLLVLGLGGPAAADRVDRPREARHLAAAAVPRLRLPRRSVVLRLQPAGGARPARGVVPRPRHRDPLLLAAGAGGRRATPRLRRSRAGPDAASASNVALHGLILEGVRGTADHHRRR